MDEQSTATGVVVPISATEDDPTAYIVPGHLVPIANGPWGLWPLLGLRGAGFPLAQLFEFACPMLVADAQRLLLLEMRVEQARAHTLNILREQLRLIPSEQRSLFKRAIRAVLAGRVPLPDALPEVVQAAILVLREADEQIMSAWNIFHLNFDNELLRISVAMQRAAGAERFREAIVWQNREALHSGIEQFVATPAEHPTAKYRKHRELVAKYLQRYCAKNDSIGFFGPVGWARWAKQQDTDEPVNGLVIQAGDTLLATREVYFETWAMDAVSETLSRDPELSPWAVPRRMPFLHTDDGYLYLPFTAPIALSPAQAAVLSACDGQRTARQIAADLTSNASAKLCNKEDVYAQLEQLRITRRIAWSFAVSMNDWRPEQTLRKQFAAIDDAAAREMALQTLDRIESARIAVAAAAGNAEQLDMALRQLETTFTDLTTMKSSREAGKMYAARTLVYEDCRRNVEVTLGPALLRTLEIPLALLLTSARWFTYKIAALYRQTFQDTYEDQVQQTGSPTIDFANFWPWVHPLLFDPATSLVNSLVPAFQKRWANILSLSPQAVGQHRLHYTSAEIRERVHKTFHAPMAGWQLARYHSPDLLIAAKGQEAIERGEYSYVLGEFHLGMNTLDTIALVAQHPHPEELAEIMAADFAAHRVMPVIPREIFPAKRVHATLLQEENYRFVYGTDSYSVLPERALLSGSLVVEAEGDSLVVRTRDGAHRFDIIEFFGEFLTMQVSDQFKMFAHAAHLPRITIDRLVVNRESWHFSTEELAFLAEKEPAKLFVATQRWATSHDIPRFVFFRSPLERKPYYLDLASPIYVEIFAKTVRQILEHAPTGSQITVTEMLPTPDDNWLIDAENQHYTSELRLVAVDAPIHTG